MIVYRIFSYLTEASENKRNSSAIMNKFLSNFKATSDTQVLILIHLPSTQIFDSFTFHSEMLYYH